LSAAHGTRRPDAAGAIIRLSAEARRLLANSGGGGDGDMVSVPARAEEATLVEAEPAAIDVEFEPIRRARERVAPAQIVAAESLTSETVTPVAVPFDPPAGTRDSAARWDDGDLLV